METNKTKQNLTMDGVNRLTCPHNCLTFKNNQAHLPTCPSFRAFTERIRKAWESTVTNLQDLQSSHRMGEITISEDTYADECTHAIIPITILLTDPKTGETPKTIPPAVTKQLEDFRNQLYTINGEYMEASDWCFNVYNTQLGDDIYTFDLVIFL